MYLTSLWERINKYVIVYNCMNIIVTVFMNKFFERSMNLSHILIEIHTLEIEKLQLIFDSLPNAT